MLLSGFENSSILNFFSDLLYSAPNEIKNEDILSKLKTNFKNIFLFIIENNTHIQDEQKDELKLELDKYLDNHFSSTYTSSNYKGIRQIAGGSRKVKKHIAKTRKLKMSTNGVRGRVHTSRKVRSRQTN
jgi:hypothetical protein